MSRVWRAREAEAAFMRLNFKAGFPKKIRPLRKYKAYINTLKLSFFIVGTGDDYAIEPTVGSKYKPHKTIT